MEPEAFSSTLIKMVNHKHLRKLLVKKADNYIYKSLVKKDTEDLEKVKLKRYQFMSAMLHCVINNINKGYVSPEIVRTIIDVLVENNLIREDRSYNQAMEEFEDMEKTSEFQELSGEEAYSCNVAQVIGEKAGKKVEQYVYLNTLITDMREWLRRYGTTNGWVPIPAAATAIMLAKGEIQAKGVIVPECLEPEPFLSKLSEMGMGKFQVITNKQVAT